MTIPATLRALRYRNFRLFFGGQPISLIGVQLQIFAVSLLVYRLTGSAYWLGLVGAMGQFPTFLLSPLGGIVADRFSRHRVLVATQTASMLLALVLAALTLTGVAQAWHILVLSVLLGVVNALDIPARLSFFVETVERADLGNAVALNSLMFYAASVIGPAFVHVVVDGVGEGWCFLVNASSYIPVIAGLLLMRLEPHKPIARHGSPVADTIAGFRFVIGNAPIRYLAILAGILSAMGIPFVAHNPHTRRLGMLLGASIAGPLAATLLLASRSKVDALGRWVAISAAAYGIYLGALAFSPSFWLWCALLPPAGFAMMLALASSNTLVQMMSPDRLRGRVMSAYSMTLMAAQVLSAGFSGVAGIRWGRPAASAGGGIICAAAAAIFGWRWRGLRSAVRRLIDAGAEVV